MAEQHRTWSRMADMARARYPNDPDSADIATRVEYEAEEIAAYVG